MKPITATRTALAAAAAMALVLSGGAPAMGWSTTTDIEEMEARHIAIAEEAAAESIVLLENYGNVLPLAPGGNIAIFGPGAVRNYPTGTGSSAMTGIRYTGALGMSTIEGALADAGFTNTASAAYNTARNSRLSAIPAMGYWGLHTFNPPSNYSNADAVMTDQNGLAEPTAPTDTAVYVLLRNSGETYDRVLAQSYYLTQAEKDNIALLGQTYKNVVVVLYVPGVTDTDFFREINADQSIRDPEGGLPLDALVNAGIPGQEGAEAIVDVLTGQVTPSGKTADTWAADYSLYPAAPTWANNDGDAYDEVYTEGIYVGYRYFDSFYKQIEIVPGDPDASVSYPFGFGLSYTSFDIDTLSVVGDPDQVTVSARVTNTGATYSGKEVVQVYASAPQTGLDKPYQELVGYAKTGTLAPGQSEVVTISFDTDNLSSYDPALAAYTLEAGEYPIRVGNSSRSTEVAAVLTVAQNVIVQQLANQLDNGVVPNELESDPADFFTYPGEAAEIAAAPRMPLNMVGFTAPNNASPTAVKTVAISPTHPMAISQGTMIAPVSTYLTLADLMDWRGTGGSYPALPGERISLVDPAPPSATLFDVAKGQVSLESFVASMSVEELAAAAVAGQASGATTPYARGAAGYLRHNEAKGIPVMAFNDGPSGLNGSTSFNLNGTKYQRVVAYPSGTNIAQMWNVDLAEAVGRAIGEEMEDMGAMTWLAPGANIHRDPLCGRNVEYYSEDPLLSGMSGAATTIGLQSVPGVGVSVKHFAANNQEAEREGNDNQISERALREIYLRSFEIIVRGAQPMSIMSSYNMINGTYTAADYELLTDVLRNEWGFDGFVMTDWGGNRAGVINTMYGGNNVQSPGGNGPLNAIIGGVAPADPLWQANGLPQVRQTESYGAAPAYNCFWLALGDIVPMAGGPLVESHQVNGTIAAATTNTLNNWVAAAERADQFSGVPAGSIQLVQENGYYTVNIYGFKGHSIRLGDVQKNVIEVLKVAMRSLSFAQLADLKGVSGIAPASYTGIHAATLKPYLSNDFEAATQWALRVLESLTMVGELYEGQAHRYTPASFAELEAAMTQARALLAITGPVPANSVVWAQSQLEAAIAGLVEGVDTSTLEALIAQAEDILANPDGYLSAGLPALAAALAVAQAALADPGLTQTGETAASAALAEALSNVMPKGDKTGLNALIAAVGGLDPQRFTPATWAPVQAALAAGGIVSADPEASMIDVENAFAALDAAIGDLVLRASKAGLASAVSVGNTILASAASYVPSTIIGLAELVLAGEGILADDDATQQEVEAAHTALVVAIGRAKLMPVTRAAPQSLAAVALVVGAAASPAEAAEAIEAAADEDAAAGDAAPAAFIKASAPKIVGVAKVGRKLKAKTPGWSPAPSFTYQWYRSGKAIAKATKATYKVTKADKGKRLSVKVKAAKPGYKSIAKASAKTKRVR
ncbi:MAG: glycoside hydrolase family 3 C-terminal domain-containing protein [Bifidobacteriaceae bacterium]|jgi:beta-glucosidase|nr:glycoside hydrolase family 3 C-terminal domain-containing protein [Bifidobacteriaceae bacterium]